TSWFFFKSKGFPHPALTRFICARPDIRLYFLYRLLRPTLKSHETISSLLQYTPFSGYMKEIHPNHPFKQHKNSITLSTLFYHQVNYSLMPLVFPNLILIILPLSFTPFYTKNSLICIFTNTLFNYLFI